MKEIKLNIISLVLIIVAVITMTSLVIVEIVKYYGEEKENVSMSEENIFVGERVVTFFEEEPTLEINNQITLKPLDMIIKENSAELSFGLNLTGKSLTQSFPLKYKVYDINNELLYETEEPNAMYEEFKNRNEFWGSSFGETIELKNYKRDNTKLIFELYDKDNILLGTLDINVPYKEFKCVQDDKFEELSEQELNYFLSACASLESEFYVPHWLINIADELNYNAIAHEKFPTEEKNEDYFYEGSSVEDVHNVLNDFLNEKIEEIELDENAYKKLEKDGKEYYVVQYSAGETPDLNCIDIKDISYSDGKYNITYVYSAIMSPDYIQGYKFSKQEINVELMKNEDGALTDFKLLSISGNKKEE